MDFFLHGQESLTSIQWAIRAVIAYFFLLFAAKIMGQRSISQLRLLDFVMALVLGNIMAHPLSDEELGLKGSAITTMVLVVLYLISVFVVIKIPTIRNFIHGKSFPLIKDNQILYHNLGKARISIDVLLTEMRKQQILDIQQVAVALWEPDGTISFFLKPAHQTVTQSDMKLPKKKFSFPITVVKEGKLDVQSLHDIGKDEAWLAGKLKESGYGDLNNILLTIVDKSENLKVFLYK